MVEILSPSTRDRDVQLKKQLYEQNGVGEYWIVDADNQTILSHRLNDTGSYDEPSSHDDVIEYQSSAVTATVDLRKVW